MEKWSHLDDLMIESGLQSTVSYETFQHRNISTLVLTHTELYDSVTSTIRY